MLLVLMAFLSACAQSSMRDPEPESGPPYDFSASCVGRELPSFGTSFTLYPFECRESTRIEITGAGFHFAPDGAAWIGIPDGFEVRGAIGCEDGAWVFRASEAHPSDMPHVAFALRPPGDPRAWFTLESVDPARPWRGWAVPMLSEPWTEGVELPERMVACATHESWVLRTGRDGRVLASGERVPDEPNLPQLRFREWESPDSAHFWDHGLDRGFGGRATQWDGRAGIARAPIGSTVCALAGDSIAFSRSGDTWTIEVVWLVPDADDLDGDDDVEDEIVRHSRYVASTDACR